MKQFLLLLSTIFCGTASAQTLQINEFMQSNIDCIMDDLVDFPDSWVELYNPTDAAINLSDYKIGTKDKAEKAWQLPDKTVAAKGYVVIYCDKAGEDEGVSAMHTNFRLESNKEGNVYLFKGSDVVDKVKKFPAQPAPNIGYGRKTDGGSEWGFELKATPNAANQGGVVAADHILGVPEFSQKGKVFESNTSFQLTLMAPPGSPDGTEIRYTTNGSEPTATSPLYNGPITVNSTRCIRAKLFCNGWLSPISTAQSYIFHNRAMTLTVVSLLTDDRYLNDNTIGIIKNNPDKEHSHNWRRPVNIEMFETPNTESFINQLGETRVTGGQSRGAALKSLAIYANKRFGVKRFEHEFFPDQKPGLKDFKSLMLRNSGNDFDYLYQRDAIIQVTAGTHMDLDWQAYRPAIIYINGVYKGMLNIRERSNEDNIYTNYNGLEDIDMVENWYELKEGSIDSFNEFKAFYTQEGHTLAEYDERMDWKEFINLMIVNLYYINLDFPGNNIVMWRPQAEGGKWRFVCKDTDFGLGLYDRSANYQVFKWLYNPNFDSNNNWGANGYDGTRLFRRLMETPEFKKEFIDRCCIYAGDFLNEKGTRAVWDPMYYKIQTEYPQHRQQFNPWWPNYGEELNKARNFLKDRTNYFYMQLGTQYSLGSPVALTINKENQDDVTVTFNGVELKEKVFDGKFFANRSIKLVGQAAAGKAVIGWKVTGALTQEVTGNELNINMPSGAIAINPVLGDASGIDELPVMTKDCHDMYDLMGNKVATPQAGRIYIQNGKKIIWR